MEGELPSGVVRIPSGHVHIEGMLEWPGGSPPGMVVFAHGSGSSRMSPRNNFVAAALRRAGLATLLMDLLTPEEDIGYAPRLDIGVLTSRLLDVVAWLDRHEATAPLPVGAFGASTGAAAALQLAAALPGRVAAVVSRGGRPDLAARAALVQVRAPTLLIVGGLDTQVMDLNELAYGELAGIKEIKVVAGATHLFEEPGTLEQVAALASDWFRRHLGKAAAEEGDR